MARAYWKLQGQASKTRFIGREKAYHGVNFGGLAVGGIAANRKMFGQSIEADHLSHTLLASNAFSKGLPTHGVELADELNALISLHDASTIAAVIIEPFSGSGGVVLPPVGYLQKIREICTKHGILLIFDEVITGFGRLGANFGADRFGVTPDMITFAKAITNGVIPMGGVLVRGDIYDAIMGAGGQEQMIEFFHGYTYSGHPIPTAAAHAVLDIFESDGLINRARALEPVLENALHALKGKSGILDIRNFGLSGALDLDPIPGKPGLRAMKVLEGCIERGALVRIAGECIAVGPPFISKPEEVEFLCGVLGEAVDAAMKINA
jgi:beta-alanine--pyruvate transaminase